MNSNWWKTAGIIALVAIVCLGVLSIFISALPYILVVVAALWLIKYIIGIFNNRKGKSEKVNEKVTYSSVEEEGEVIDVEYKDVD